jgi:hypothetical protein
LGCCRLSYDQQYRAWRFFRGMRDRVFKRDGFRCRRCGTKSRLLFHHRDRRNGEELLSEPVIDVGEPRGAKFEHSVPSDKKRGQRPGGLVGESQRRGGGDADDRNRIALPLSGRKQALVNGFERLLRLRISKMWSAIEEQICSCQWRIVVAGTDPIKEAIPSLSIVFNASASAAWSVMKDSFQTVEFLNSSTTSNNHPALPSS